MAYVLVDRSTDKPRYFIRTNRRGPFTIHVGTYALHQARTYRTLSAATRAAAVRRHFVVEPMPAGVLANLSSHVLAELNEMRRG